MMRTKVAAIFIFCIPLLNFAVSGLPSAISHTRQPANVHFIPSAAAGERLGVEVYPGAKSDPALSKLLMKNKAIRGEAFLTGDNIEKVAAFYRKQGLLLIRMGSASRERVRFKKMENGTDVVIQQSWTDPRTNEVRKDTLILIMQEK